LTQNFVASCVDFEVAQLYLYSWFGDCHTGDSYLKGVRERLELRNAKQNAE